MEGRAAHCGVCNERGYQCSPGVGDAGGGNRDSTSANGGGFLQFHVAPGEVVVREQAIATNTNLLGVERSVLYAPFDGVVIGMTTLPAVTPGEPVCHLGRLPRGTKAAQLSQDRSEDEGLEERLFEELSTNFMVVERSDETEDAGETGDSE